MNGSIVFYGLVIVAAASYIQQEPIVVKPEPVVQTAGEGWSYKVHKEAPSRWDVSDRELEALYRTVWGEVRGQGAEEQAMAVHVILNRWQSGRWGNLEATVKAPWQFSVWNKSDPNYRHMVDPLLPQKPSYKKISALCDIILAIRRDGGPDPTGGANHYHHPMTNLPRWAVGQSAKAVGKMKLYKL